MEPRQPVQCRPLTVRHVSSLDYSLWYGWSEMVQDLTEIRELSQELRAPLTGGAERSR